MREVIAMEFSDELIGPASIAELRKTIAICTQTHQTDLKIIQNGNYTDGTTIFISPPPTDIDIIERWILFEALTIHESWHILFQSDFYLLQEFVQKYEKNFKKKIPFIGKIAHDILNIIEDARIESHGKKRFAGTKNAITYNNIYWLKKRPAFKEMKDWQIFIEGLLQLGVCGGLKEPIVNSEVESLIKIADFYLQWAKTHEKSRASFIAAEKIMDLFLNYFEIEGSYSQQISSPPSNLKFEPKSDSSNSSSSEAPPDLPKELQEDLEKIKENKDMNRTDSNKDEESHGDNQNQSENTLEPKEKSDDREKRDSKDETNSDRSSSKANQSDIESDMDGQDQPGMGGESGGQEQTSMGGGSSEQAKAGMGCELDGQEEPGMGGGSSGQKLQSNSGGDLGKKESTGSSDNLNRKKDSKRQDQSELSSNSQAEDKIGEMQEIKRSQSESEGDGTEESDLKGESSSDLLIINIDDMDPLKLGLIDPIALKIKIDDLVKRNYSLSKDRGLEEQTKYIVKEIEKRGLFKDVFYTKTFDIGAEINLGLDRHAEKIFDSIFTSIRSLIQVTVNQFKALFKSGSQITAKLKFGRLDTRKMVKGLINEDPHIFKKNIINEGINEIAIALLIDQSGSMTGDKINNAQKAAILFGEVLNALDLNFAIYGWTDIAYYDEYLMYEMNRRTRNLPSLRFIEFPPEINPEIFTVFCYKEFDENYESAKQKLGLITALCDNSDHNAIEFMTGKLLQSKKRIKILLILSDGQPYAISYEILQQRLKRENPGCGDRGNIGINLTRQAIETAQKFGIQTICISIDTSKNYQEQIYGGNNFIIIDPKNIQELPIKVAKILSLILRRSGVKL